MPRSAAAPHGHPQGGAWHNAWVVFLACSAVAAYAWEGTQMHDASYFSVPRLALVVAVVSGLGAVLLRRSTPVVTRAEPQPAHTRAAPASDAPAAPPRQSPERVRFIGRS